jgi:hypothetical protein
LDPLYDRPAIFGPLSGCAGDMGPHDDEGWTLVRKTVMAGALAAGALGVALAVGGAAYAAGDPDTDGGQQVVRVVENDGGTAGDRGDCPGKGGDSSNEGTETPSDSNAPATGGEDV